MDERKQFLGRGWAWPPQIDPVSGQVLLSEYEAHPVAVMEAASLGRPVVVAETTGLRELIVRGLARGVPLDAAPSTIAAAIARELDAPPRAAVPLPRWDDCSKSLLKRYRLLLGST